MRSILCATTKPKLDGTTDASRLHLYTAKVIHVGDAGTGKTTLIQRITKNSFRDNYAPTIGVDLASVWYEHPSKPSVRLQLWDTAGQEMYRSIIRSYYRGAYAIVLLYDVTNHDSFRNVYAWCEEVDACSRNNRRLFLVANKIDSAVDRVIFEQDGRKLADRMGACYLETSAKCGTNTDYLVAIIGSTLWKDLDDGRVIPSMDAGVTSNQNFTADSSTTIERDTPYSCC